MLVGHILVHRQPALHALDLALLHTDLLELVEDVLGHAVLQATGTLWRRKARGSDGLWRDAVLCQQAACNVCKEGEAQRGAEK